MNEYNDALRRQTAGRSDVDVFWDARPEWTHVSFGLRYSVSAAVAGGRILITRSMGYGEADDVPLYADFIRRVIDDGIGPDQPYVHVFDWSDFSGGSLAARNRTVQLFRTQRRLQGVVFCTVGGILRMMLPLTRRLYRFPFPIATVDDLAAGIRVAAEWLSLALPQPLVIPTISESSLRKQTTGISTREGRDRHAAIASVSGLRCQVQRIGSHLSLGRFEAQAAVGAVSRGRVLEALGQMLAAGGHHHTAKAMIWDLGGIESRLPMRDLRAVLNAVLDLPRPAAGLVIVGGWRSRCLVFWLKRMHPVAPETLTSSISVERALERSRRRLRRLGLFAGARTPVVRADPGWIVGDIEYTARNEIIDTNIVHSVCSGFFRDHHVQPVIDMQKRLLDIVGERPEGYYLLAGVKDVRGASPKARRQYVQRTRGLFEGRPFRIFVFYAASGLVRAAIHMARQMVPYRVEIVSDLNAALELISADMANRSLQPGTGASTVPLRADAVQRYADDLLHYLGAVNWDPEETGTAAPEISDEHPFKPVFEAIDLITYDLETLFKERKAAEEERQKLEKRLAQSRKMEAMGLLAGGVAHDLNNVLSGIVSYPDLMLMDMPEEDPMRKSVEAIRSAGQRASAIVQDLLTLARRGVSNFEVLNTNDVVRRYLDAPEHLSLCRDFPNVPVSAVLDPNLLNINGSRMQLRKSLMNLVRNAVESHDGVGAVTIRTENRYVDRPFGSYDTVAEGEYVVLEVTDQGSGIPLADLPHIFEPFYTRKVLGRSGTGLGMAIVWGTIQDHSGYIDVASNAGAGTTITIYLPATRAATARTTPEPTDAVPTGNGQRVLVVDDVAEQRDIATRILDRLGYRVVAVSSGEAALDLIVEQPVDLVLMDMIMDPGMDGLDTCRCIWERIPGQKVIIVSGFAENERIVEARRRGALAYVKKPYTIRTIAEAVDAAFKTAAAVR